MIPILYTADETRFVTNGIGRLSDCVSAIVSEERNGIYELEFQYPISGEHYEEIQLGRIVACTHDDRHDIQPFVIYQKTIPDLNGVVTFNAHHISYKLSDIVVMPYSAGSVSAALEGISDNSVNANPFTFWTDKTTTANFEIKTPRTARNMLGGEENSILDVFGGGEYEFDKFAVKLYADRGVDSDVEIRYSKNLVDLNQKVDESGSYNAVVPYWTDGTDIVTLPEKYIAFSGSAVQTAELTDHNLIIIRTEANEPIEVAYTTLDAAPMDMSDAFEEKPTANQLRDAAAARFQIGKAWLPDEALEVDFVQLWQTKQFEDYTALQRVRLCDTVSVYYPQGGITKVKQKVIKTNYNVLLDRYDSIELGKPQTTLGQAIKENVLQDVPTTSMMESAIQYATDLIRGGLGGYVVMTPGPNGYPQEILIMDTPDVNTAVNVWRFNQGGLGHSSNGYNGPFSDIALTQDGKINASMITAGILNANLIRAGVITDASGTKNSWDLASGYFKTTNGEIGGFLIGSDGISAESTNSNISLTTSGLTQERDTYTDLTSPRTYGHNGVLIGNGTLSFISGKGSTPAEARANAAAKYTVDINFSGGASGAYDWLYLKSNKAYPYNAYAIFQDPTNDSPIQFALKTYFTQSIEVGGTKSRRVKTEDYEDRLLYCYETPTPLFGDIGEGVIDSDGACYVDIDDIFTETIEKKAEYQVFLQREGEGDCYVAEKTPRYFVVKGTPGMKFAWEIKAKQKDYALTRLERAENSLDEYETALENMANIDDYITEQEELLYG